MSGVGNDPLGLTLSSACWEASWCGAGIYNLVHVVLQLADAYSWDKDRIACEFLQGRMEYTWNFKDQALLVQSSHKQCCSYISSLYTFPFPVSRVLDVPLDVSPWRTPNHSPRIHCCKLNSCNPQCIGSYHHLHAMGKLCSPLSEQSPQEHTYCCLEHHLHLCSTYTALDRALLDKCRCPTYKLRVSSYMI